MKCKEAQVCISRDVDGELREQERAVLQKHLAQCHECSRFAERCRQMQRLISEQAVPMPEGAYWTELWQRITEQHASHEGGRHAARTRFYRILLPVAAAACLVLAVGMIVQHSGITRLRTEVETLRAAGRGLDTGPWGLESVTRLVAPAQGKALAEQLQAFHLVNDYFGGGLQWMVQDGAQSELGLSAPAEIAASQTEPEAITVEIRLLRAEKGGKVSVVSAPTLMILAGAEANFFLGPSRARGPKQFLYRCTARRGTDGRTHIGLELTVRPLPGGEPVKLCGVATPDEGQAVPVAFSRVGETQYVLLVWTHPGAAEARSSTQT